MEVKCNLFARLDEITQEHTLLATNTSSLPITEIAASTKRPDKVIGMHFMNPVPVMKLVEIIRGLATTDESYQAVEKLAVDLGKTAVEVNDFPGFVSNRILMPMINEAIYTVYDRSISTPTGPISRASQGRWSRPTAWWWVIVAPASIIASEAAALAPAHCSRPSSTWRAATVK